MGFLLRLTNGNCFAALRRLGLQKNPVGLKPFMGFSSATFFCARKMLAHFLYRAQKNVSYLERYATVLHWFKNISIMAKSIFQDMSDGIEI